MGNVAGRIEGCIMTFWFAEYFGPDYKSQRAEIDRLARLGGPRKDAGPKARALQMLEIDSNGKPRSKEPERIAGELKCKVGTVRDWIEDFQTEVKYLVKQRCVITRAQAWHCIKNLHPDAAIERGILRSESGRNASKSRVKVKARNVLRARQARKTTGVVARAGLPSRHDCPTHGPESLYLRGKCCQCESDQRVR